MKIHQNIQYITPRALMNYLEHEGWIRDYVLKNGLGVQYLSPDQRIGTIIPMDNTISDYYESVLNLIDTLATYYNCSNSSLIIKLSSPLSDILKWRVNNIYTRQGTIPLEQATDLIDAIKSMISASICDIKEPAKRHKRISTNTIEDYYLGQSERGSYIINVMCPLSNMDLELFDEPIARRSNEHILKNISDIQNDLSHNNNGKIEENIYSGIYSSNFMDAIADISEAVRSDIELSIDWCQELPINVDLRIPNLITIESQYTDAIRTIASKFTKEEVEEQHYVGKICELKAHPDIGARESGLVKILTFDENENKCKINIKLDKEKFQQATEAFEQGRNIVASGKLIQGGRDKTLEITSFQVLE